jgi:hypothetical protein
VRARAVRVCLSHVASGTLGAVVQVDLGLLQALAALVACEHHHLIEVALQACVCVCVGVSSYSYPPRQCLDGQSVSLNNGFSFTQDENPLTMVRL